MLAPPLGVGVGVCEGIGGVALTVVGVPGVGVVPGVAVGVVGVVPGVGTEEVVVPKPVTATTATFGLGLVLLSAAYAATEAPTTSKAVVARIAIPVRQPGPPLRLPGAPVPHCRHQSWASCRGSPHFAHARVAAGASEGDPFGPVSLDPCAPLDATSDVGLVSRSLTADHSYTSAGDNPPSGCHCPWGSAWNPVRAASSSA